MESTQTTSGKGNSREERCYAVKASGISRTTPEWRGALDAQGSYSEELVNIAAMTTKEIVVSTAMLEVSS